MNAILNEVLFPFSDYWRFYLLFTLGVLAVLLLDLGVFHRKAHEVKIPEAIFWSLVWIGAAIGFYFAFEQYLLFKLEHEPRFAGLEFDRQQLASTLSHEFLAGYLLEKALAVDNLFVFVLIFNYFSIPSKYQHRILFWGILGAVIMRAWFIALGAILMQYHFFIVFFGLLLLFTGLKMLLTKDAEPSLEDNGILKFLKRVLPLSSEMRGQSLLVKEGGKWLATPLLVALIFIEISDVVFAIDSIPAIFAITKEPLIVFTSNMFAILGLRSLYFILANMVHKFHLLKVGLALVLMFIGLKMVYLSEWYLKTYGEKFPIGISLGVICGLVTVSVIASLVFPAKPEKQSAQN